MAELAGFIIILFVAGACLFGYGFYRGFVQWRAHQSRWYVEIRDGRSSHAVGVYINKKGGSNRISVGELPAGSADFQAQLEKLVEQADQTCAVMNANQQLNKTIDSKGHA